MQQPYHHSSFLYSFLQGNAASTEMYGHVAASAAPQELFAGAKAHRSAVEI